MVTRKKVEQILDYIRIPKFIYEKQFNLALLDQFEEKPKEAKAELELISKYTKVPFGFFFLEFDKKIFKPFKLPFFIPVLVKKLPIRWAGALTVYPFIFFKNLSVKERKNGQIVTRNYFITLAHELTHLKQQRELLLLPFALIYFAHFLLLILRGLTPFQAYGKICFEAEAFVRQFDLDLVRIRKPFSWLKYCKLE